MVYIEIFVNFNCGAGSSAVSNIPKDLIMLTFFSATQMGKLNDLFCKQQVIYYCTSLSKAQAHNSKLKRERERQRESHTASRRERERPRRKKTSARTTQKKKKKILPRGKPKLKRGNSWRSFLFP